MSFMNLTVLFNVSCSLLFISACMSNLHDDHDEGDDDDDNLSECANHENPLTLQ